VIEKPADALAARHRERIVEMTARTTYSSTTQFGATNVRSGLSLNTLSACREVRDLKRDEGI
jgi:hypothetical protein